MSIIDAVLADNEQFKFLSCTFAPYTGTKTYHYKTMLDIDVGDHVVVYVPNSASYQVVEVKEVHSFFDLELRDDIEYRWVVQKVDSKTYLESIEKEKELASTLRKATHRKARKELTATVLEHLDATERETVTKLVRL
jgi:hypothetical protein